MDGPVWHDQLMSETSAPSSAALDPALCYRALLTRDARFDGRFFTAVRTTGIYCRPVCPAQTPKPENCSFYPSAAAAEVAGYRSCLRCRPERAPSAAPAHRLVERAMALIAAGAKPNALPARLGIGERQLRRLFAAHLGASPAQVAQTRRNLLARQLVEETQLPLTEVALASGFESLRRFNHVFLTLYGRPPSAMRRGAVAPGGESGLTLSLPFRPPYDWAGALRVLAAHAIPGVEMVVEDRYQRVISLGGHHGTITIVPGGADHLRARIDFPALRHLPQIVARLRGLLDLGADPGPIDDVLARDPRLMPWVAARPGLRLPGAWDPFETAVRIILAQQVSLTAARQLSAKLVMLYGQPVETGIDGLSALFPEPGRLVAVRETLSLDLNMPRARAAAIVNLAEAVRDEPDLLEPAQGLEETIRRLTAIAGIGPWTAQCIALMAMGEPDAFPAQDVGLQRAIGLDARALAAASEAWRPWRAYAAIHLWLQAIETKGEKPHALVA
jgi:AraC family transcriptional regulator of adaptative response / DNA-3-methyladenine glycosylase II